MASLEIAKMCAITLNRRRYPERAKNATYSIPTYCMYLINSVDKSWIEVTLCKRWIELVVVFLCFSYYSLLSVLLFFKDMKADVSI